MPSHPSPGPGPPGAAHGPPNGSGIHGQHPSAGPGPYPAGGARTAPAAPPPGTDLAADLGAGLTFAGRALLRNPVAYLVSGLVYTAVIIVITIAAVAAGVFVMLFQLEPESASAQPDLAQLAILYAVIFGVMLLAVPVLLLWQSGAARSAGIVHAGDSPSIGQAMIGSGRVILTSLLMLAIVFIGMLLCYIPGLIAGVMLLYAVPAAIRGATPVEAVKESFALAKRNLGTTVVAWLVMSAIASASGLLLVTVVISIPLSILFQFGLYERLNGRTLPEPAQA